MLAYQETGSAKGKSVHDLIRVWLVDEEHTLYSQGKLKEEQRCAQRESDKTRTRRRCAHHAW